MGLSDDLRSEVKKICSTRWSIEDGRKIPKTEDIGLGNVGKRLELVVLYADLANSTGLVRDFKDWFVAEIAKAFLVCCVRIIRDHDGAITSFDGDRVMAVFHGGQKNSNAARAALKINYAVKEIIVPQIRASYPKRSQFSLGHCVGIDRSEILVARSGIRNNNDLVWIGRAANYAAILSEQRDGRSSYITDDVYDYLLEDAKKGGSPSQDMWARTTVSISGRTKTCYYSTWKWEP